MALLKILTAFSNLSMMETGLSLWWNNFHDITFLRVTNSMERNTMWYRIGIWKHFHWPHFQNFNIKSKYIVMFPEEYLACTWLIHTKYHNITNSMGLNKPYTLKTEGCHDAKFVITGCHNDNQWWQGWHHDNSQFSSGSHLLISLPERSPFQAH